MRLLIASTFEPLNEMHGQGVIIRNTLVAARNHGSQLSMGLSLFRGGARGKARECESEGTAIKVEYSQPGPILSKGSMARCLLRLPLTQDENTFLRHTAAIAVQQACFAFIAVHYRCFVPTHIAGPCFVCLHINHV